MLIAFCGVDGSGKTTQLKLLEKYLISHNEVFCTKQPSDWYRKDERLRSFLTGGKSETPMLMQELALFAASDRLRHIQTEIIPKLDSQSIVITDRYVYSTYAYFMARGLSLEWLMSINKYAIRPDITLYIDIPANVAVERVLNRDGDKVKKEEKDIQRLSDVRNVFIEQPWGKSDTYYVLDGTKSIEILQEEILAIVTSNIENNKL